MEQLAGGAPGGRAQARALSPWNSTAVDTAITMASPSSPGLDGIPYEAYNKSKRTRNILKRVGAAVCARRARAGLPEDFNHSRLICLPKKVSGIDLTPGEFYIPENTRPFSIANTDNRLIVPATNIICQDYVEFWQCFC